MLVETLMEIRHRYGHVGKIIRINIFGWIEITDSLTSSLESVLMCREEVKIMDLKSISGLVMIKITRNGIMMIRIDCILVMLQISVLTL
jgi:hypothetical protein